MGPIYKKKLPYLKNIALNYYIDIRSTTDIQFVVGFSDTSQLLSMRGVSASDQISFNLMTGKTQTLDYQNCPDIRDFHLLGRFYNTNGHQ